MSETQTAVKERVGVIMLDERMERIGLWASLLAAAIAIVVLSGDLWQIVLGHTLSDWQHTALRVAAFVGVGFGIVGTFASWYHYLRVAWRFVVRHIKPNLPAEAKEFAADRALDLPDAVDQQVREHVRALRGCRARTQPPAAVAVAAAAIVVAAVTLHGAAGGPTGPSRFRHVTSLSIPAQAFASYGLAADHEGNLWFIGPNEHEIERLAPNGSITTVPLTIPGTSQALTITAGPDGNIWVGENAYALVSGSNGQYWNGAILRITPSGSVTAFPLPPSDSPFVGNGEGVGPQPGALRVGPDGQIWYILGGVSFGDASERIEHITTDGRITRFPLPKDPDTGFSLDGDFAFGADGNLWFDTQLSSKRGEKIVRVSRSGAILGEYPVPGLAGTTNGVYGLATGPDGAVWFGVTSSYANTPGAIGRISTSGAITLTTLPDDLTVAGPATEPLIAGPDHTLWMSVESTASGISAPITRILHIAPSGVITQYVLPDSSPSVTGLMFGPDGTLWVSAAIGPQNSQRQLVYKITV